MLTTEQLHAVRRALKLQSSPDAVGQQLQCVLACPPAGCDGSLCPHGWQEDAVATRDRPRWDCHTGERLVHRACGCWFLGRAIVRDMHHASCETSTLPTLLLCCHVRRSVPCCAAPQNVVETQLEADGSSRAALGREAFEERVWSWKEE